MPSAGSPLSSNTEALSNPLSTWLSAANTTSATDVSATAPEPTANAGSEPFSITPRSDPASPSTLTEEFAAPRFSPVSPLRSPRSPRSPSDVRKSVLDRNLEQKLRSRRSSSSGGGSVEGWEKTQQPDRQEVDPQPGVDGEEDEDTVTPTMTPNMPAASSAAATSPAAKSAPTTPPLVPPSDSQVQLNKYRERLARDLSTRGGRARVSPIQEESARSPPPTTSSADSSDLATGSTESGQTIRGTPMLPSAFSSAQTPSYPFPRMHATGQLSAALDHPFPSLSPSIFGSSGRRAFGGFSVQEKLTSGSSTPASAMTFHPDRASQAPEQGDYPTPSLYDLSLMLSAEPGLDAWWNAVVEIMAEVYQAERVSLAVPADATDVENVPWGQRATYNSRQDDELSNGYMARGVDPLPTSSSEGVSEPFRTPVETPRTEGLRRPGLQSRHSFTRYEDEKGKASSVRLSQPQRPSFLSRSKSYFPSTWPKEDPNANFTSLNQAALAEHDAAEPPRELSWESYMPPRGSRARVHAVLQAFDLEADPLIDGSGVNRVLERGKVIALTRSYPYLAKKPDGEGEKQKSTYRVEEKRKFKKPRADSSNAKLSSILSGAASLKGRRPSVDQSIIDDGPQSGTPKYEEYEQPPPSPWTQSPAPSPAVRADPSENPFFQDATVDEGSFNPSNAPEAYQSMRPPEAIGIDNSWSVLHVPLPHLILSKRFHRGTFKLDPAAVEAKSSHKKGGRSRTSSSSKPRQAESPRPDAKPVPIAILSILSPVIPYPANLRHSLEHLAPHLATTFSLARQHSMLELEISGFHRRNTNTLGFGAVDADGRPLFEPVRFGSHGLLQPEDLVSQRSLGSITSPSDYSGPAISLTASPGLTPGWDTASLSQVLEKRLPGSSPSMMAGDSYFGAKGIIDGPDKRQVRVPASASKASSQDSSPSQPTSGEGEPATDVEGVGPPRATTIRIEMPSALRDDDLDVGDGQSDDEGQPKRGNQPKCQTITDPSAKQHTQLHSYGADFTMSGQSLPPGFEPATKPSPRPGTLSRTGSTQLGHSEIPYPSNHLRSIILDLLPLQIFVARPQTGEITWVNSRFLSYRGQNIGNLRSDPYGAIHPEDRPEYLKKWAQCVRAGTSLETDTLVRIRRFDSQYRLFAVRAVPIRDRRGAILHFLGSFMDVHKQYMAEMEAKTKAELEASEAKHRLLANLIPQIIFTATENEGITFANEQWLSYTSQSFDDSLGIGFLEYVHPEDLARCRIPAGQSHGSFFGRKGHDGEGSSVSSTSTAMQTPSPLGTPANRSKQQQPLPRADGLAGSPGADVAMTDLAELARKGVVKVSRDSSGRQSYTTEVRLRSRSGEYRWHLVRCVEIDNVDFGNGASSYFGSATDINDHKLLEVKLKEAMESKGRFLSNMSHEIRTPLIGISGMVSFLQDTALNEEQRDYTNTIQTSAKSLLLIINDILDLSKVDAGMMKLSFEWFHTRSLIEDVNELVWTMAVSKGLELNYVVEQDVPSWVKGDRVRIRQVLLNVIGNAIKFTSEGEVFSHCRVYTEGAGSMGPDEIMLEFSIIDTGRGFTKEESELIFKPFSQIDGSSTRQHGGSGLGLVISRQLVELHGGKMNGSAIPGRGSTFTFTAKFKLPSDDDYPDAPVTPQQLPLRQGLPLFEAAAIKEVKPIVESPAGLQVETEHGSPPTTITSSASSDPSLQSGVRSPATTRSSMSSVNAGLARFGEAARASGQDLSQMKLEMPSGRSSPGATPTPETGIQQFRPRVYSILIVCPQKYNRKAIMMHIEMTIPQDVPSQITPLGSIDAARQLLTGDDPVSFTHVVLNCSTEGGALGMLNTVIESPVGANTTVLFLADSKQRQAILKATKAPKYQEIVSQNRVFLIPKPAKPFRFAVIFDPAKERDLSHDHNRSRALQIVETQKQTYLEAEKRMGNKGYRVLLVEDNLVNQKVLLKYLLRIGLDVEVANDGMEATEKVFSHGHDYYSIILCDLHMPRKDGYQTCEEIRSWEKRTNRAELLPIIALSANVMSDVEEKCFESGFSDYVTKPVDFGDLSTAMSKFFQNKK